MKIKVCNSIFPHFLNSSYVNFTFLTKLFICESSNLSDLLLQRSFIKYVKLKLLNIRKYGESNLHTGGKISKICEHLEFAGIGESSCGLDLIAMLEGDPSTGSSPEIQRLCEIFFDVTREI